MRQAGTLRSRLAQRDWCLRCTSAHAAPWTTTQLLTVSSQIKDPITVGGRILDVFMETYAITVIAGRRRDRELPPNAAKRSKKNGASAVSVGGVRASGARVARSVVV